MRRSFSKDARQYCFSGALSQHPQNQPNEHLTKYDVEYVCEANH